MIQALIIATSGRFTADAVALIEKHNNEGKRPHIEAYAHKDAHVHDYHALYLHGVN